MNILIACGGTGGHINPAISVASYIKKHRPSAKILFAGAQGGMEERLVADAGFEIEVFPMRGFVHRLTPKALWENAKTAGKMLASLRGADRIIDGFKPDIVFGTGGFACFPTMYRASKKGIPTVLHESNVQPGRTARALEKYVDLVLTGFEDSQKYFKNKEKLVHTGNPLREGMVFSDKKAARAALGVGLPLVYSAWGSLGAREMNKLTAELFKKNDPPAYAHIHSTGAFGYKWMPEYVAERGVDLSKAKHIDMREYVYDAPTVLAAADLALCRTGAMTVSELCATGTPSIVVPSPNVSGRHQHPNARALSDRGAAVFFEESDATPERLDKCIRELLADPERLDKMGKAALGLAIFDAEARIYAKLMEMLPGQNGT